MQHKKKLNLMKLERFFLNIPTIQLTLSDNLLNFFTTFLAKTQSKIPHPSIIVKEK